MKLNSETSERRRVAHQAIIGQVRGFLQEIHDAGDPPPASSVICRQFPDRESSAINRVLQDLRAEGFPHCPPKRKRPDPESGLTDRLARLMNKARAYAISGEELPTNAKMAAIVGLASASSVADGFKSLAARGLIWIESTSGFNATRLVRLGPAPVIIESAPGRVAHQPEAIFPTHVKSRAVEPLRVRTCQYIAGEPGPDDACKCGADVAGGGSYCAPHLARCYESKKLIDERLEIVRSRRKYLATEAKKTGAGAP